MSLRIWPPGLRVNQNGQRTGTLARSRLIFNYPKGVIGSSQSLEARVFRRLVVSRFENELVSHERLK